MRQRGLAPVDLLGVCIVCGSKLLLPIWRGHPDNKKIHCNHCGSEIPQYLHNQRNKMTKLIYGNGTVQTQQGKIEGEGKCLTIKETGIAHPIGSTQAEYPPQVKQEDHDVVLVSKPSKAPERCKTR